MFKTKSKLLALFLVVLMVILTIPAGVVASAEEITYVTDSFYDFDEFQGANDKSFRIGKFSDISNNGNVLYLTHLNGSDAVEKGARFIPVHIDLADKTGYEISFDYYARAGIQISYLDLITTTAESQYTYKTQVSDVYTMLGLDSQNGTNGEWKHITVRFNSNTDSATTEKMRLGLRYSKPETKDEDGFGFFIDNLKVKAISYLNLDSRAVTTSGVLRVTDEDIAGNTSNMLSVTPTSTSAQFREFNQPVTAINTGRDYEFEFKYYSPVGSQLTKLEFTAGTASGSAALCSFSADALGLTADGTGAWKTAKVKFSTDFGDSESLNLGIRTTSSVANTTTPLMYLDDIVLNDLGATTTVDKTQYKYYIDYNDKTATANTNDIYVNNEPVGGLSDMHITFKAKNKNLYPRVPAETVTLENGKTYMIEFDYYTDLSDIYLRLVTGTRNSTSSNIFKSSEFVEQLDIVPYLSLGDKGTNSEWKTANIPLTVKTSDKGYDLGFRVKFDEVGETFSIDNLRITEMTDTMLTNPWDGTVAENFTAGTGAANDPIIISTADELAKLVNDAITGDDNGLGKYYVLNEDIYLNNTANNKHWEYFTPNEWYSAGNTEKAFCGNIDGRGHSIYGVYYDTSMNSHNVGLFPVLGYGAIVANINLKASVIRTTGNYAGGIVGAASYQTPNETGIIISACSVDEGIVINAKNAGGIAGYATGAVTFNNCYSAAEIIGSVNANGIFATTYSKPHINYSYSLNITPAPTNSSYSNGVYTTVDTAEENIKKLKLNKMNSENMLEFNFAHIWKSNENSAPTLITSQHNGDVNLDGSFDSGDLVFLLKNLLGAEAVYCADVNWDNKIDVRDLVRLKKKIS